MADSPFKGLLYSPEVLGGIGLLTAGLSGQNPGAALPMIQQGMKTASMFKAMEEEEEKRRFKKLYADSIPSEDKALFNFAPVEYIKNREFKKRGNPNIKEIYKDGKSKTFDISKSGQLTEFLNLTNNEDWTTIVPKDKGVKFENFVDRNSNEVRMYDINNAKDMELLNAFENEPGRSVIKVPTMDKSSDLASKTTGALEETITKGTDLLSNLTSQELQFKDEFLTTSGKVKYAFLLEKDRLSNITKKPLTQTERQYVNSYSEWQQTNLQYFNNYRKLITGVAAGEKEIGWLQESIPSEKDTPSTYRAKLKNQIRIQKSLIENARKFKATKGKIYNDKGEYSKEYLDYIKGKVKPSGEYLEDLIKSMKIDNGYDADTINGMLDLEFRGIDWREIFETYLQAKQGNFPG